MYARTVQNPRHKCDLGNKNDSVTDKKTNCRQYLTVIITIIILRLYYNICVCTLQLTLQVLLVYIRSTIKT